MRVDAAVSRSAGFAYRFACVTFEAKRNDEGWGKEGEAGTEWKGAGERNGDKVEPSIVEKPSLAPNGGDWLQGWCYDCWQGREHELSLSPRQRNPSYFPDIRVIRPKQIDRPPLPLKIFRFDYFGGNSIQPWTASLPKSINVVRTCGLFLNGFLKTIFFPFLNVMMLREFFNWREIKYYTFLRINIVRTCRFVFESCLGFVEYHNVGRIF